MGRKSEDVIYNGMVFQGLHGLSRHYGLGRECVANRMKRGWTMAQAVGDEPSPDAFEYNGKFYETRKNLCIEKGISESIVCTRIKAGWSLEEAVGDEVHCADTALIVNGVMYNSINALAHAFGIRSRTVYGRICDRGWTPEQAVGIERRPNKGKRIAYMGIVYDNSTEIYKSHATNNGVSLAAFIGRINYLNKRNAKLTDESIGNALVKPVSNSESVGYIYKITNTDNGKIYIGKTFNDIYVRFADHKEHALVGNNKNEFGLAQAMRHHGVNKFTIEEVEACSGANALSSREMHWISELNSLIPNGYNIRKGSQRGALPFTGFVYGGESFASTSEAVRILAKRYNLPCSCVRSRLNTGAELSAPLSTRSGLEVEVFGKKYKSISRAASEHGVRASVVRKRIASGWSIDDAIKTPTRDLSIEYEGVVYATSIELAKAYGAEDPELVSKRISKGLSIRDALTLPKRYSISAQPYQYVPPSLAIPSLALGELQ